MFCYKRAAVLGGLLAVLLYVLPAPPRVVRVLFSEKHRIDSQTTFFGFDKCTKDQSNMLKQAHHDAIILAEAALDDDRELATTAVSQYINFDTVAAIEYFGPPDKNTKWRQRIFDTFYRATTTYRGWGLSDWWYQRYVQVGCDDVAGACQGSEAYTYQRGGKFFPYIVYCPRFFDNVELIEALDRIRGSRSDSDIRKNVMNLYSQGRWIHHTDNLTEIDIKPVL